MSRVLLESVSKHFGDVVAVDAIDLEVADRELLVLVGPSGCGKSTTLRLVAGLEQPTDGTIRIGDRVVNRVDPMDRNIAMVFQNYALYPHMSVFRNMAFGLQMRKVTRSEIAQRVAEAAAVLGIEDLMQRRPGQLSGGQRQRVALGRAIVRDPEVFLLDEPLSNLDARLRVTMRSELVKLHRQLAATMVYVTHDQVEAMTMGDRIVVMHEGQIHQADAPLVVYESPANRFVAEFIGSPPMNIVRGRVETDRNQMEPTGAEFVCGGLRLTLPRRLVQSVEGAVENGGEVDLGIRPEDLHVVGGEAIGTDWQTAEAVIQVAQLLGADSLVELQTAGSTLLARFDGRGSYPHGESIEVAFDMGRVHLFNAATGERL
ncbi:MAG: ABC transporter ATP-binding protein [Planctomycetaceae bacterium]|jgi:multiple sugar transport system ATP-binding protein|nr:ABC transporter ATP-binding protein [Planctomycetaceae bacterium]